MKHVYISQIGSFAGEEVILKGWLYNRRSSKKLHFLQLRDGSGFIQGVLSRSDVSEELFEMAGKIPQESSVVVRGMVRHDPRAPFCDHEIGVSAIEIVAEAEPYPISKKDHGDAFLMDHRHLWLRSFRQHTVLRVRATLIRAIRDYLDDHGFINLDSPIFTPAACEGTTTLFSTAYFDQVAYLSQSGQLYQEAGAMAFGRTYCFGPTFRAEKSKTRRHLTEFWMVEPEVAYLDLEGDMDLCEDFLCAIVERVLNEHGREIHERLERDLGPLEQVQKPFPRLSYTEAVEQIEVIGQQTNDDEQRTALEIEWGSDFGSPHETELTKRYDRPIMVHRYPAACKAFYMKKDPSDRRLALAVDVLAPEGYGEIIGGGEREDDLQALLGELERHKLPVEAFDWFLDLRRYGTVPHSGFGLGLERTVAWICGLKHLRETIPFARTMDRLKP